MIRVLPELTEQQLKELNNIFFTDGKISPFNADKLKNIRSIQIQAYAHKLGLYGIFTKELIQQFKNLINGRSCIEVGAGNGTLGRALNIPMYDNFLQLRPEIKIYYIITKQPIVNYGQDVLKMDGLEAIKKHRPKVVIGSWVTHKYNPKLKHLEGSHFAFEQKEMFNYGVEQFIMYGSLKTHYLNPLFKSNQYNTTIIKNDEIMYSRNGKNDNCIYIVEKR